MSTWQMQEARTHFHEVVQRTLAEGPQWVSDRGQSAVVVVSAEDFRRLNSGNSTLISTLLNAPRGEAIEFDRSPEPNRDIDL
jgi:antitoxin Phd